MSAAQVTRLLCVAIAAPLLFVYGGEEVEVVVTFFLVGYVCALGWELGEGA